ncbi:hypothetical protein SteCoe_11912 [Stentor coeruleus]|uniref:Translin-associated factor X-interacting protein 1 N-terminal domain-containing protein n=1 Tax=Stentor coeruleus TaxID=5963 RepID=A0A1R2CC21_9CILI|nr:hypothetical protein SteCoe_11912 [Stentor coeruleus]
MKKNYLDDNNRGRSKCTDLGKNIKNAISTPYSKPFIKPRSVSTTKSTTAVKQVSAIYANSSLNLSSFSHNPYFSSSKNFFQSTAPVDKTQLLKSSFYDPKTEISEYDFDQLLEKDLKDHEDKFKIYQKYFTEFIKSDKKYGIFLSKIKAGYELRMLSCENSLVAKLKNDIKEFQEQVSKEYKDRQLCLKKIEKLSRENVELSKILDEAQVKYNNAIEKIKGITSYDMGKIPKDEMTWKALAFENQSLSKFNRELQRDLKALSAKEKKLSNLFIELKKQGFPVDQVYEKQGFPIEQVYENQFTKSKIENSTNNYIEETDNEALVSGRPKEVIKPAFIPKLKLGTIIIDSL